MMNNFQIIFLISIVFFRHFLPINSNLDAKKRDKIKHLPGLEFSPNFEHYSGYLRILAEHELFYWLVTSQHNSTSDPLIFWFNGGPGCSSLFGLLGELGPYLVDREGEKLVPNPNAWNRHASVVYIESPSFVGYSIPGNSPNATDITTAKGNYAAIKEFMTKFPEYRHHQLFITGESYAGIYLPTLAEQIIDGQKEFEINFRGMAIGNGYVNVSMNVDTRNRYYYGHGMVDEMEWEFVKREKCQGNIDDCDLSQMHFGIKRHHYHYNPYDIYETCVARNGQSEGHQLQSFVAFQQQSNFEMPVNIVNLPAPDKELICENEHDTETYLNRKDVRKALHVSSKVKSWQECAGHTHYKQIYYGVEAQVKKTLKAGIPVLLFYGDTDTVCNFLLGAKFAASLGHPSKAQAKPWIFNGQLGGFKTTYAGGLTFITVRGSGHMVPQKKGPEILHVIEAFIQGKEF